MAQNDFAYSISCPLCGQEGTCLSSQDAESLMRLICAKRQTANPIFYQGTAYEILHCPSCDHYFQSTIPINAYKEVFLEEQSNASLQRKIRETTTTEETKTAEIIPALMGKPADEIDVLEFGSGWGFWLLAAHRHGCRTTGVEVAPKRAEHARSNGLRIVANLDELRDERFDYIHADQVLEHIQNPAEVLKALVQHLKPKGVFYIGVPDGDQFKKKYQRNPDRIYKEIFPFEHVHCFTRRSLKILAASAQLRPLSSVAIIRRLPTLQGLKIAARQHLKTGIYFEK